MITAHSDKREGYQYRLLDQIWRDACSGPFEWGLLAGTPGLATYRNRESGATITCQGMADGSHVFTFDQGGK